jgi:ATPase subunit of ABC transporter with duplicated ATPase domains
MKTNFPAIEISHVSYAYPGTSADLFTDLSASFPRGWTALLGDNGLGKSTLAQLMIGRLHPTPGQVTPSPSSFVSAYCSQETEREPSNLPDFCADWSQLAIRLRETLGIEEDWLYRYSTLSSGQRKRVQISCAMAENPDVLILDEPTNHVDASTREAISRAATGFAGIGIVISHDTTLIDSLASRCVFMEVRHQAGVNRTVLIARPGNYTVASATLASENTAAAGELKNLTKAARQVDQMKARLAHDARIEAQHSNGRFDHSDRELAGKIKMAKISGRDNLAALASNRAAIRVEQAHDRVNSMEVAAKRYDGNIFLGAEPSHRAELVRLGAGFVPWNPAARGIAGSVSCGVDIPDLSIGPRDHISLTGDNGLGKTTLVNRLLADLAKSDGTESELSRLVIPQEVSAARQREALAELHELPTSSRAQVMSGIAQLNSNPDRVIAGSSLSPNLSPGEMRKLLLCLGVLKNPALIIMDEPTNHLDLHSIEALGVALADFPGALLLVSHDENFLARCTSINWNLTATAQGSQLGILL